MAVIDELEIRKAIQQFHPDGELFEVRIINPNKRNPILGLFSDVDTLIKALSTVDLRGVNVYFTLNQIDEDVYSRTQHDRFVNGAKGVEDPDVTGIKWLFIDLDPERKTGISSTNEELQGAFDLAKKIYMFLKDYGFEEPVKAVSGNTCKRGEIYAVNECVNPVRTVTSTVKCEDGSVVPVKTLTPIAKDRVFEAMEIINNFVAPLTISIGDVIIEDVCGSKLVATGNK
jgi:CxxC motif-containing protein